MHVFVAKWLRQRIKMIKIYALKWGGGGVEGRGHVPPLTLRIQKRLRPIGRQLTSDG